VNRVNASSAPSLTYRSAQRGFAPPAEPLRKFGNPGVVCEGWYPVGHGGKLGVGDIERVAIGPREVVLYRDLAGTLRAVERACPHLGADLARGEVVERGLRCAFHRWCWGPDGTCTAGAGAAESRRIQTYEVRERWGVAWMWAGGSPAYELPEPEPANARVILRLPSQRLDCSPHVMLGNGLDFTHVAPVHRFTLLHDPEVHVDAPYRLTAAIHGRFGTTTLRRLLLLAGCSARWRFTTIGPSLAWLSVQAPTPFELVWAGRPLADGSCATQTVLFLPRRRSLLRALPMIIATTARDKGVLEGLRLRQGFVPSDAVFCLYARLVEAMPEWSPER
jgi:phenylpropionate dioxygenase-like ring-hydroxylating dioxygenase large terminal subunit